MVIGQKTMFVRTAGCDYSCVWCDSAFTWDGSAKEEIVPMSAAEIWKKLNELAAENFSHVTISGGNPGLLRNLAELIGLLKENGVAVAIETQGSCWQDWFLLVDNLTISPKPPSSKMNTNDQVLDNIIARLTAENRQDHISLKVVVFDEDDFQYAKSIANRYPEVPFFLQAGNDDITSKDHAALTGKLLKKYAWLTERAMADKQLTNVRVLPQLHAFVWGNKRGV